MGKHSYGDPQVISYRSDSGGRVEIGNFCSIASGVTFLTDGEHRADFVTSSPMVGLSSALPEDHNRSKGPIIVGHDVWIGRGATILSGVSIATGAVIGAYSVVSKDIGPYAIAVGNPAIPVRLRFPRRTCYRLLRTGWWLRDDAWILENRDLLWSNDVEEFLAHVSDSVS